MSRMFCLCCCLIGCSVFFVTPASSASKKQRWQYAEKKNRLPMTVKKSLRPKRFALLIGISEYKNRYWPTLKYTPNDVSKVQKQLMGLGSFDKVYTLTKKQATTKKNILSFLERLKKENHSPQDTLVIYVSSHGTLAFSRSNQGKRFIVTSDTQENIPKTAISVESLRASLESFTSQRKVLILATCYTGQAGSKSKLTQGAKGKGAPIMIQRSKTMLVLSASSYMQPAFESKRLRGDVYTHFLLSCWSRLSKRNVQSVSASQAHACAVRPTYNYVQKHFGQVQVPGLESQIDGIDSVYLTPEKQNTHGKLALHQVKKGYLQIFREYASKWSIRFFRQGQKSSVIRVDEPGDVLMEVPAGRYQVVMVHRENKEQHDFSLQVDAGTKQVLTLPTKMKLEARVGFHGLSFLSSNVHFNTSIGFSWSFVSLHLGYFLGQGELQSGRTFRQHHVFAQVEMAWKPWFDRFGLELGGFLAGGFLLQESPQGLRYGPLGRYGAHLGLKFRVNDTWAVSLPFQAGFVFAQVGSGLNHKFYLSTMFAFQYQF